MSIGLLVVVVFVLAVGFAVLTGWLAERKGYSFPLFAFLGLFLGIFALIIAAVMPAKKPAQAET
jgi:MFS family permease